MAHFDPSGTGVALITPFKNGLIDFDGLSSMIEHVIHGGVEYIAGLFGCDPKTVEHGRQDVAELPVDEAEGRIRKKGGPQES